MERKKISLVLPANTRSLEVIRGTVRKFIFNTPYQLRTSDILLAVSEASANVVRHAYDDRHEKPQIVVECLLKSNCLVLTISDNGKGLILSNKAPVFSENGGFGLFLMQRLADGFKCQSAPGSGTVIELRFNKPERFSSSVLAYAKRWSFTDQGSSRPGILPMRLREKKWLTFWKKH